MWNGYDRITKIVNDLNQWMDEKGYRSFDEIRGIALGDITTVEELAKLPAKHAVVDPGACTNCGLCQRICMYRAISEKEGARWADSAKCDGCGVCQQMCPAKAIVLE